MTSPSQATNVLVVMSDQHERSVLGVEDRYARTPNLDALSSEGTRFTAAYSPSPICVPSRAAWAAGRPVHEIRLWDNAMGYQGQPPGWGAILQATGRRVESIGKLHYQGPTGRNGFDREHLAMYLKDGIGQVWGSVRDPMPVRPGASRMVTRSGPGETAYTRYDRAVTEAACSWLADPPAGPWVLYVGLVAPHFPYIAPPDHYERFDPGAVPLRGRRPEDGEALHPWVQLYADCFPGLDADITEDDRRRCTVSYYALVSFMDDNLGRILDALDRSGQTERTTVVYTSDHGDLVGSRGLWGKSLLYEPSAGIPLIVRAPDLPSAVCSTPTTLVDGRATILDAAGLEDPDPREENLSWLTLATTADSDRVVLSQYHAMGAASGAFLVRQGNWKLHHYVGFPPELFDLATDPAEANDRSRDPAAASRLAHLTRQLEQILDPESVDAQAKQDQAALVERFGGPAAAAGLGTVAETPAPDPN